MTAVNNGMTDWRFRQLRYPVYAAVLLFLLLAAWLRLYGIGEWLRFTGDEARDALAAREIMEGDGFPLLGPKIHRGFGYLGPAYYYLLAVPLFLLDGDPTAAGLIAALFDLGAIFLVFVVGRMLFGTGAGFAAAALYAISFNVIFYARWGWHPSLVPFLTLLSMRFILAIAAGRVRALPKAALIIALALHFHLSTVLLLIPLALAVWRIRSALTTRLILFAAVAGLYPFLPVLLYDVGNGFPNIVGLFDFARNVGAQEIRNPVPYLLGVFQVITAREIVHKHIPLFNGWRLLPWVNLGLIVSAVAALVRSRGLQSRHVAPFAAWALAPLLVMILYPGERPDYYLLLWFPVPLLLVGYLIDRLFSAGKIWRVVAIGALVGLIVTNLATTVRYFDYLRHLNVEYSHFYAAPLGQKRAVVQAIAVEAGDSPFDVVIVSLNWPDHIPYAYLFSEVSQHPHDMYHFEVANNPEEPYQVQWLDVSRFFDLSRRASDGISFVVVEPHTLPLPDALRKAVSVATIGTVGIYRLDQAHDDYKLMIQNAPP